MVEKSYGSKSVLYFIEHLSMLSLVFYVLPTLLRSKATKRVKLIYFIDGSKFSIKIATILLRFFGAHLEHLSFKWTNIYDDTGDSIYFRIIYFDLPELMQNIVNTDAFQSLNTNLYGQEFFTYLEKKFVTYRMLDNMTIWRRLMLIQIVRELAKQSQIKHEETIIFMYKRAWQAEIINYAWKFSIPIITINDFWNNFFVWVSCHFTYFKRYIKSALLYILKQGWRSSKADQVIQNKGQPMIMVDYYGHLNLDCHAQSDLFFYKEAKLTSQNILIAFSLFQDPLDQKKWKMIETHGLSAVALDARARTDAGFPTFFHFPKSSSKYLSPKKILPSGALVERLWLKHHVNDYCAEYNYWIDLFHQYNVKTYVSWDVYKEPSCVLVSALRSLGGIAAFYQKSFLDVSSRVDRINADLFFAFSKKNLDVNHSQYSNIRYHVVTGYLNDCLFVPLQKQARGLRSQLEKNGAEFIISYFDENSIDDSRWHFLNHSLVQENYQFLLEKLLENPSLGLILKAKVPRTLIRRLGPIAGLFERAKATGRCILIEGGALHGSHPPALAALASDVAIHGYLYSGTAGIESALAGVPTLFLDRQGWSLSSLYALGEGKVVFKNWNDLWQATKAYWEDPKSVLGFADWSHMINEFDPFRDGKAAERIGTYLKWINEGFESKLPREIILADTAERYGKLWGYDKITAIAES